MDFSESDLNQWAIDNQTRDFANRLMAWLKVDNIKSEINIFQALWVHHRMRAVEISSINVPGAGAVPLGYACTIDVMNLIISGDMEVAFFVLDAMTPDDMTQPYHWLSSAKIAMIKNEIAIYLGWA